MHLIKTILTLAFALTALSYPRPFVNVNKNSDNNSTSDTTPTSNSNTLTRQNKDYRRATQKCSGKGQLYCGPNENGYSQILKCDGYVYRVAELRSGAGCTMVGGYAHFCSISPNRPNSCP
ncbi:hypothetical protein BCR33DRAFT_712017 [Rhizoclosmatium globosum]|uniref:Carbohydrate-binding module family 19 domain-containing protein n=1 Tax=Rhizoclosmatium globosum TaxID=329046 RepID=A0A1Y2CXR8_9FUNG|nr:hypothetical protein BCR33DRAFT_712017 [Rhizoclosmatium globosum]|eukprot:ORY51820.1 hypothetical protein BCR33DRAFT_712017 [Rhizoclosmatium globosum]